MSFPKKHLTVGGNDPFLPSLVAAINHATEISVAIAFVKATGFGLIHAAILDAINRGVKVRILTGDYLGITDLIALRQLMLLQAKGAETRVFETEGKTSFHMKAYLFTKSNNGLVEEGCAFVGSSNLSNSALMDGLEWNLRVDKAENQQRFQLILDEYEVLYNDPRCKTLSHQWIDAYAKRIPSPLAIIPIEAGADEIEPAPTPNEPQSAALEALLHTREAGYRRGLVVMATGMGKTWLAAFDSVQINAKRVLFVAHRQEILDQAEETFVRIRPDAKVGRYTGQAQETTVDMLFASIQTLGKSRHLDAFGKDYFDYLVVDEFHHAAASTYQRLLAHFSPRFLLGLTATPDRTDQSDILSLCDDNLVFSKDLFDGIKSKLLCPFHYHGVADIVDYQEIKWRNGKFDPEELVNQLATIARAKHNYNVWLDHHQTRTLAFCVSKKHADFMAEFFNKQGVKAVSVHSDSEIMRNEALSDLRDGKIQVIFSVDLFNEGVDLPSIDTVLMLRPTESKIVFLQQLGRGLRVSKNSGKDRLVVLDFIGNHISFFRKPEALFNVGLTNDARKKFLKDVKEDNLTLPEGCFVNYDLQSIDFMEKLIGTRADIQIELYRSMRDSLGRRPSPAEFYRAGGAIETLRKEHGQWHALVAAEGDLTKDESICFESHKDFLLELETTNLTKSFKLVLLEAFMELEGFNNRISPTALAEKSFEILRRRRSLLVDLPVEFQQAEGLTSELLKKWHRYWLDNPVNAWIGGNKSSGTAFFELKDTVFSYQNAVPQSQYDSFVTLVQELIDLRFFQYEARLSNISAGELSNAPINDNSTAEIPYFTDLKIACGFFRGSPHETENIEYQSLSPVYGQLDPAKHFIATASGDSMDGGAAPIKNGDLLLLELLKPKSEDPKNGDIVAIRYPDASGNDRYLLRTMSSSKSGPDQLIAQNNRYSPIVSEEGMDVFARLKEVLKPWELHLHRAIMREDIPPLFGLVFNKAIWEAGHVVPKNQPDQFLLVTLNKQGRALEHRYRDYFEDAGHFHWQSQNLTAPSSKRGKAIIEHHGKGSRVHLFVRKHKLEKGKGAPFIYCGTMQYQRHSGEKPMSVNWALDHPLSENLLKNFM